MIPKVIQGATHVLGSPEGWDAARHGAVANLHVRKMPGCVLSAWEPTPKELQQLNNGGLVLLGVAGPSMPPVMLTVGGGDPAAEAAKPN
ncbi:MAG: hypothetical protein GC202_02135 [Alphaproteobacteria bacterium]|nr:hypothetical protein [Alphaproteobacteria bacterium]